MQFSDFMDDPGEQEDDDLLPSREETLMEMRHVKQKLYKTSTMSCCLKTRIFWTRLWTRERVVWTTMIICITALICVSTSIVIKFASREKNHSITPGFCVSTDCNLQPNPRLRTARDASPYNCCCNMSFTPLSDAANQSFVKICSLPYTDCMSSDPIRSSCWLDPYANTIWWKSLPDYWIIELLANLAITLAGILAFVIMLFCTPQVPENLMPEHYRERQKMEENYHAYYNMKHKM